MTFDEFEKTLREQTTQIKQSEPKLTAKLAVVGRRFIDDNFRSQAWEGEPWEAVARGGTILVLPGGGAHLKNSFNAQQQPGQVRIYSNVPYAAVHNEGFDGTQSVKAHKRSRYQKLKRGKKKKISTGEVKAHTRHMKIKQRQFAPTTGSPSPTLEAQVSQTITDHFSEILKP